MSVPGFDVSGRDWWIEDAVTTALRAAKPKARSLQLTDAEANRYIDEMMAEQKREREARAK